MRKNELEALDKRVHELEQAILVLLNQMSAMGKNMNTTIENTNILYQDILQMVERIKLLDSLLGHVGNAQLLILRSINPIAADELEQQLKRALTTPPAVAPIPTIDPTTMH